MGSRGYKVFVGRLHPDTRTRDLEKFFKDYGFSRIRDISLKSGFAFVEFDDDRDADDAVYELNHKDLLGSRITLEHARQNRNDNYRSRGGRGGGGGGGGGGGSGGGGGGGGGFRFRDRYGSPYNTEYRLIIENVSTRCGWQDIKDFFRQAGEVTFAKCHREKVGEGVVEFATYDDLKRAVRKLDGAELFGKRIRLIDDSPKDRRVSRSPRRSYSRSRSRSRSPRRRSPSLDRSPRPRSRSISPRYDAGPSNNDY